MTTGNMQYGAYQDAGSDVTQLTSAHWQATLSISNDNNKTDNYGNPTAIWGAATGIAVYGESSGAFGAVAGQNTGTGSGVTGESTHGNGVTGSSTARNGVQGSSNYPEASGVYGENTRYGYGVAGRSWAPPGSLTAAVFGDNPAGGPAGIFNGSVSVNGLLTKAGGGFKIDNPADPANSYLCHSFVESPDMTNVYSGNITTGVDGNASVALPAYFEALNRDFCYQLTVVGQFAQAIVAEEINNNSFIIRTDKPKVKVSWQVTGIRQDAWASAHRIKAEVDKPDEERGRYLAPEEYGQPAEMGIFYRALLKSENVGRRMAAGLVTRS